MIEYLYTGDYNMPAAQVESGTRCMFHIGLFNVADKYDLESLADVVAHRFKLDLRLECLSQHFPAVIQVLYGDCPDIAAVHALRAQTVKLCLESEDTLLQGEEHAAFRTVLENVTTFNRDFYKASMQKATKAHEAGLKRMTAEYKAAIELVKIRSDEARIQCSRADCNESFVARPPADERHCPYCLTGTVKLAEVTLEADVAKALRRLRIANASERLAKAQEVSLLDA